MLLQKTFTENPISKKVKKNRGEMAKYLVINNHPAIKSVCNIPCHVQGDSNNAILFCSYHFSPMSSTEGDKERYRTEIININKKITALRGELDLFIINNNSEFVQPGLPSYTFFNLQTTFESYNYLSICHYPYVLYHAS